MKKTLYTYLLLACVSVSAMAQQRGYPVSPDVQKDNSVTFRFSAPNAKEVLLDGQFLTEPVFNATRFMMLAAKSARI